MRTHKGPCCASTRWLLILSAAFAAVSVAAALRVPSGTRIREGLLDRVRGTTQGVVQYDGDDCTTLNVNALNNTVPPPNPLYVGLTDCTLMNLGSPCIGCAIATYTQLTGDGNGAIDVQNPNNVSCTVSSSNQGTCQKVLGGGICITNMHFNCPTGATVYPTETSGE